MGASIRVGLALLVMLSVSARGWAVDLAKQVTFDIPPQKLSTALLQFAQQARVQLVLREDLGEASVSQVSGLLTIGDALSHLLEKSGLGYRVVSDTAISVGRLGQVQNKLPRNELQLAGGEAAPATASAEPGQSASEKLEEVVVTAQKRVERLKDVPVPVTVVDAQSLADDNQTRLKDYYSKVPGLNLVQTGDTGQPVIAIRGLVTGGQSNPTVAYVIDDVPYGATINPGTLAYAPDIDPSDLVRIEVLRGPQGTLYGASSLGGLLKFVTVDPSMDRFSGRVQAGTSSVRGGDTYGYSLRGSFNIPLTDTIAVRASGFTREDPGYVDNIQSGQKDINDTKASGGRLSVLWRPADSFSLKLNALLQNAERNGSDDVDLSLNGGMVQRSLRGTGTYGRKTEAYSATMNAKLSKADLTSITGYSKDKIDIVANENPFYDVWADGLYGVTASSIPVPMNTKKFTQEIRASLPIGERVQWLLGAFYTDENFDLKYLALANDAVTAQTAGTMLTILQPVTFKEYSAFTNVTFNLTDRLDIQVGGRFSKNRESFSSIRFSPPSSSVSFPPLATLFYGSNPSIVPEARASDNAFTYLLTPRFKLSPNLMIYARLASGYRPGGANANCSNTFPCKYGADTTENYDIGVKGDILGGALSFDASVYFIDWKDIQIPLVFNVGGGVFLPYTDNVAKAKSQGVELAIQSQPVRGLHLSGWIAWNDATLEASLPPSSGVAAQNGDRLPYSSRLSGNLSLEQEFPLWGKATGLIGGSVSYVDDRRGQFQAPTVVRATFPSYTQFDLQAGARYEAWRLNMYLNNITDKRGVLRAGSEYANPALITYIQPRTIGLQLQYQFD